MSELVSEKGHAKNIANTDLLLSVIRGKADVYKPSNSKLKIDNLQRVAEDGQESQKLLNYSVPDYSNAVRERQEYFRPINRFITKLRKSYKAVEDITEKQLENFMTIARRIKGERKPGKSKIETAEQHSVSQQSYDQRTNNMEQMVALLEGTKNFNPNEEIFKVDTLKGMYKEMLAKTRAVNAAFAPMNANRTRRDAILYANEDNLVDLFNAAKDYLFSILDSDSAEYKAVGRIRFRKIS